MLVYEGLKKDFLNIFIKFNTLYSDYNLII